MCGCMKLSDQDRIMPLLCQFLLIPYDDKRRICLSNSPVHSAILQQNENLKKKIIHQTTFTLHSINKRQNSYFHISVLKKEEKYWTAAKLWSIVYDIIEIKSKYKEILYEAKTFFEFQSSWRLLSIIATNCHWKRWAWLRTAKKDEEIVLRNSKMKTIFWERWNNGDHRSFQFRI